MLSVDWTDRDRRAYIESRGKTVPDFHLPIKTVIAVPFDNNKWDVFWSEPGGTHAEDNLRKVLSLSKLGFY